MKKLMRLVLGASCLLLGAGAAFAEPSVEITKVKLADARDGTVEYAYTVSGDFEGWFYDLVVKVTSDDGTKSAFVTNKFVTTGSVNTNVNVKALLGKPYPGVSLFAKLEKRSNGIQLWAGGPYWAEFNVGAEKPEEYGGLYTFSDCMAKEAAESIGAGWRLPTKAELESLLNNCDNNWIEQNGVKGRRFTGKGDYLSRSIFLPAAGYSRGIGREAAEVIGFYWSSTVDVYNPDHASYLDLADYHADIGVSPCVRGLSVRAVRDAAK